MSCQCPLTRIFTALFGFLRARLSPLFDRFRNLEEEERKAKERERHPSSHMTYNRLQALDGRGYRQCYMEKIREVASEVEQEEPHKKQYWFGVPDAKAKSSQTDAKGLPLTSARVTNTRLNALVQSIHEKEEAERSGIDSEAKQD